MSFEQRKHLLKFRDVKLLSVGGVHTRYWDVAGEQWIYVPGVSDGQCLLLCLGDYCWRYRVCFSWNLCNLCWVCLCISLRSCTRLQSQLGKCILQKPLMKGCRGKFILKMINFYCQQWQDLFCIHFCATIFIKIVFMGVRIGRTIKACSKYIIMLNWTLNISDILLSCVCFKEAFNKLWICGH